MFPVEDDALNVPLISNACCGDVVPMPTRPPINVAALPVDTLTDTPIADADSLRLSIDKSTKSPVAVRFVSDPKLFLAAVFTVIASPMLWVGLIVPLILTCNDLNVNFDGSVALICIHDEVHVGSFPHLVLLCQCQQIHCHRD